MMFCSNCGSKNSDQSAFCENCGSKLDKGGTVQQAAPPPQAQTVQQPPPPPQPNYGPAPAPNYGVQGGNAAPLTTGQFIVMFLLMSIPILNIILMFKWAFGSMENLNKKAYARAVLILALIGTVIMILFSAVLTPLFMSMF